MIGLNGLNNNTGLPPALAGNSFMASPDTLSMGIFPQAILGMTSVDSFCSNIEQSHSQMQAQFLAILMQILSDPNINHMPEMSILNNFRPNDYSSYGSDGDKIAKLEPAMQQKTMQLLDYAKSLGYKVKINSGYRTQAEEDKLRETRAEFMAKTSPHRVGKAVDISISGGSDSDYEKLGDYAKSIGMRWGGDFKDPKPERWHFDYGWR